MPSYNNNIPQPTDLISSSQSQILDNFKVLDTSFAVDHTAFSIATNAGDHKQITFPAPPTPIPTPIGMASSVYPNLVGANQELFFKNAGGAVQLTGPVSLAASGYTTIPGGLLLQWRVGACVNGAFYNFPKPFTSAVYSVTVTSRDNGNTPGYFSPYTITLTNFQLWGVGGTNFYMIAIGV